MADETRAGTPSPAAQPTPSTIATSTAGEGWHTVPDQPSVKGVQFQDVLWTGTRFVATGVRLGGEGVFLDSSDGLIWHLQTSMSGKMYPARLAAGPNGVVAVGHMGERLASWISLDGLTWTARADAFPVPAVGTDTIAVTDVVATDAGWLAVGHQDHFCQIGCGLAPVRAMVWTSNDGLHWSRVADQGSFRAAGINTVARGGGGFVAAGSAQGHAAFWTSSHGSAWIRVADDPIFRPRPGTDSSYSAAVYGIAADHGVIVAVGMDVARGGGEGRSVRAWWSADGRTWAQAIGDRFLDGQVFGVASTPDGFLATGPSGEPSCLGGIWASTEGRVWRCEASNAAFTGFGPYMAAASGEAEVAVGLTNAGYDQNSPNGLPGAVWWRALR